MFEVIEEFYGAHQSSIKIKWLIMNHGFYWLSITKNCISYAKGCP
jgi:hypothetical protein